MKKEWYVVNTVSGHEYKVKEKLEMRINSMDLHENIFRVIVPEQKEIEYKNGVKKEKVKKMFPGYVLVEMVMSDEAWYIVRNPCPISDALRATEVGQVIFRAVKDPSHH